MTNVEIQVNEYVRTIDGYIRKVTQVNEKGSYNCLCWGAYFVDKDYKHCQGISAKKIKSHSFNIIDIIEEDDIGIMRYKGLIFKKFITKDDILELKFKNYELLEIVTKEQFKAMEYEVGEDD